MPPPHSPLSLQGPQAAASLSTVPSWPPWSWACLPTWPSSGRWPGDCPVGPLPVWTPSQLPVSVKVGAGWQGPCSHSWRSHQQRQQLAKARAAELGALDRDPRHAENSVFLDSPSCLAPCAPSQGESLSLGNRDPARPAAQPT